MDTIDSTKFKDEKGRVWDLALTLGTAMRINRVDWVQRGALKTPFEHVFTQGDEQMFVDLANNTALIYGMIWFIIMDRKSLNEASLKALESDEEISEDFTLDEVFASAMSPKACSEAQEAFWNSLKLFFPSQAILISQTLMLKEKALKGLTQAITDRETEIETALNKTIELDLDEVLAKGLDAPKTS